METCRPAGGLCGLTTFVPLTMTVFMSISWRKEGLDLRYKTNVLATWEEVLKPIWTYDIQLWGCAATSNIDEIKIVFQNKVLRGNVDAPWCYRNDHLHRDLKIPTIRQEIQRFVGRHERRLHNHVNTEVLQLLDNTNFNRRLKRIKTFELCSA
jgi:hypothetical protein